MEVVLGIDIGGTFTKFGLVDKSGNIHFEEEISTVKYATIGQFITGFHQHMISSLEGLEEDFHIQGIGVGAPNANFYSGSIENSPNLPWKISLILPPWLPMTPTLPLLVKCCSVMPVGSVTSS